ncbi:MAG: NAD-binding protein [Marmoricola sp.]
MSTTGYGDIAPASVSARLVNAFLVTPLRIAFLVLLIGTTLEVLATQGREQIRALRWRKNMIDHVVIIGYGVKGEQPSTPCAAMAFRVTRFWSSTTGGALSDAHNDGIAVVTGDATRRDVLRRAGVEHAKQVIITVARDDTAVLTTLTIRQLNPTAHIIAAVREPTTCHWSSKAAPIL